MTNFNFNVIFKLLKVALHKCHKVELHIMCQVSRQITIIHLTGYVEPNMQQLCQQAADP